MSTKANEIAALERKMKDTSNKTIQAALKKKIERLKAELKGEKPMTANQLATTLLKAKGKVREMNSKEFSAMIKRLSAKPEYKFLKGMEKSDIERDLERQAKPVGWRFRGNSTRKPTAKEIAAGKKSGKVYFEDRANRSDVSRVAQLKRGGGAGREYIVSVGNIGNIQCKTLKEAEETYKEYVRQSESESGRASGEVVQLLINGEPAREHFPIDEEDDMIYAKGGGVDWSLTKNPPKTKYWNLLNKIDDLDRPNLLNDIPAHWLNENKDKIKLLYPKRVSRYLSDGFHEKIQDWDSTQQYAKGGGVGELRVHHPYTSAEYVIEPLKSAQPDGSIKVEINKRYSGEANIELVLSHHEVYDLGSSLMEYVKKDKKHNSYRYADGGGVGSTSKMQAKMKAMESVLQELIDDEIIDEDHPFYNEVMAALKMKDK